MKKLVVDKLIVLGALFFAIYIELMLEAQDYYLTGTYTGLLDNEITISSIYHMVVVWLFFSLVLMCISRVYVRYTLNNRFIIIVGITSIIIGTVFCVSGSSIGVWNSYLNGESTSISDLLNQGTLWGIPRTIRSDEWAVFTPFNISQSFNHYASTTEIIRGSYTDVTTTYGLASYAIVTMFRPFLLGYILWGSAHGLAFYWVSRTFGLLFVSYEFGKILTNKKNYLSFAYACLVTFSQTIQWWYSINGLLEMFLFGQLAIVLIDRLLHTDSIYKKTLYSVGLIESAGGFVFTLYPAQEIPLAYVFLILLIIYLVNNKSLITRIDVTCVVGAGIVFILLAGWIIYNAKDAYIALLNTEYPGNRMETGGGEDLRTLFYWVVSIFSPVDELRISNISNASDAACFYSLFPLGFIYSLYRMFHRRQYDLFSSMIMVLELFFIGYCFIGYPTILAKISLLSYSLPIRVITVIGYLEIILLFYWIGKREKVDTTRVTVRFLKCIGCILLPIFSIYMIYSMGSESSLIIWGLALLIAGIISFAYFYDDKTFAACVIGCVVISGLSVNPLQVGLADINNSEVVTSIESIVDKDPDGTWVVLDAGYPITNLPIMAGAHTINSTNVYPNIELWNSIDLIGEYSYAYNRYAHIIINIVDEETSFEVLGKDLIVARLSESDFDKLDVDYILTDTDYSDKYQLLDMRNGYYIYKNSLEVNE